ncbi:VOC family protein [Catellatospora sp. NPDC049609]|uniref:VOC family protein n=1 Tax=Catellatospora sp. NPDC049609 TaxID=3155505 RepID=UPI00343DBB21
MTVQLLAVTYDAHDPARLARFWGGMLRRDAIEDGDGLLLPGTPTQVGLRFVPGEPAKEHLNRLHLHLTSASLEHQRDTVAAAVAIGAEHVDVGQLPEDGHIVLADPAGNLFCVIEPGNNYLAGCGFFAELACDGTRDVGLFWSEALGWPLVWNQNEETAIQSPLGGTKVAWGGPPVAPKTVRNTQRFLLAAPDTELRTEIDRLVSLGASLMSADEDGSFELADPDGNEFGVRRA